MTSLSAEPTVEIRLDATADGAPWPFVCPDCLRGLRAVGPSLRCPQHGDFARGGGIWRFLTEERAGRYARFVREYGAVRLAEGRGAADAAYYLALPFEDRSGRLADQWRIRAGSFRALLARVVAPLEVAARRPLDVVDVGSGNGWLSWRLSQRGHRVAAVDVFDDVRDGLGAHAWYARGSNGSAAAPAPFTSIQADFDRLPLADGAADLVIFNASLHYSTDIAVTLGEALRVLRPGGHVAIVDSPVYRSADSGRRMVEEREASYRARFGFPSNALPSESWFTVERLDEVAAGIGMRWRVHVPWHGVRWTLRPWLARARRRREPSSFWLMVGEPGVGEAPAAPTRRGGVRAQMKRAALYARHRVLGRRRAGRAVEEIVAGRRLTVLPGVFSPRVFRTGAWLAEFVAQGVVVEGSTVLDLGTGTGAGALAAADRASRVVAVDVSPEAVRCADENARQNDLAHKIDVRAGDLFGPLRAGERFDLVLFNPPFYRGAPTSAADAAWRSVDVPERFARGLAARLTPGGRALVVLSSDCDVDGWLRPAREAGLTVRLVAERDLGNEVLLLYRIAPPDAGPRARGGRA